MPWGRAQDLTFTGDLARRGLLAQARLRELLGKTAIDAALRERMSEDIARDFKLAKAAGSQSAGGLRVSY